MFLFFFWLAHLLLSHEHSFRGVPWRRERVYVSVRGVNVFRVASDNDKTATRQDGNTTRRQHDKTATRQDGNTTTRQRQRQQQQLRGHFGSRLPQNKLLFVDHKKREKTKKKKGEK